MYIKISKGGPHVLVPNSRSDGVILKSGSMCFLKVMAHVHNHKKTGHVTSKGGPHIIRWSSCSHHNVGPRCNSYEAGPMF